MLTQSPPCIADSQPVVAGAKHLAFTPGTPRAACFFEKKPGLSSEVPEVGLSNEVPEVGLTSRIPFFFRISHKFGDFDESDLLKFKCNSCTLCF